MAGRGVTDFYVHKDIFPREHLPVVRDKINFLTGCSF
jgi:hypothetical protein